MQNFYYLDANRNPVGPVTEETLFELHASGALSETTLVSRPGGDSWFPLKKALKSAAEPAKTPAVAPTRVQPQPAARPQPQLQAAYHLQPAPHRQPVQSQRPARPSRPATSSSRLLQMPGIGRLAFFGITVGTLLLAVAVLLAVIWRSLGVAHEDETKSGQLLSEFVITYIIAAMAWNLVAIIAYALRARNIGWSPVWVVILSLFLFPLAPFIWAALQMLPPGYAHTRKLDLAAMIIGVLYSLPFIGFASLKAGGFLPDKSKDPEAVWHLRATHQTRLTKQAPSPQAYEESSPPPGVQAVTYPSGNLVLKAWYAKPAQPGRHPALVYFHGGYAFGAEDFEVVRSFHEAGFAVMTPMLRGENGNPGWHEHYYGELDDAEAAIRWIKQQPEVDAARVVTFGHSAGGVLSIIVSFNEANALLLTGSAGGMYDDSVFVGRSSELPFNTTSRIERGLRSPALNAGFITIPHVAYVGSEDPLVIKGAKLAAKRAGEKNAPLTIEILTGDHSEMLEPAVQLFLLRAKKLAGR